MGVLAAAMSASQPPDSGMRIGRVESVDPLRINVGGGILSAGYVGVRDGYYPAVGDSVGLLRQDATWMALGAIQSTAAPDDTDPGAELLTGVMRPGRVASLMALETTTSATFANMINTQFTWTKRRTNSEIMIQLTSAAYLSAGTSTQVVYAVNIGGIADLVTADAGITPTATRFTTAGNTIHAAGDIGPGTYECWGRWRRSAGAGTIAHDGNDFTTIIVTEV